MRIRIIQTYYSDNICTFCWNKLFWNGIVVYNVLITFSMKNLRDFEILCAKQSFDVAFVHRNDKIIFEMVENETIIITSLINNQASQIYVLYRYRLYTFLFRIKQTERTLFLSDDFWESYFRLNNTSYKRGPQERIK